MPRLSTQLYLQRHHFLRKAWTEGAKSIFAVVPAHLQWDVHKFYQPDHQLTDGGLIEHRRAVSKSASSLPQRVSRAFLRIQDAFDTANAAFETAGHDARVFDQTLSRYFPATTNGKRIIRVAAIARPEPDYDRLVGVLLDMARRQLAEEGSQEGRAP
jgi:hypothetical protein